MFLSQLLSFQMLVHLRETLLALKNVSVPSVSIHIPSELRVKLPKRSRRSSRGGWMSAYERADIRSLSFPSFISSNSRSLFGKIPYLLRYF